MAAAPPRLSVVFAVIALTSILTLSQAASFNESCPTDAPTVPCTGYVSPVPSGLNFSAMAALYGCPVANILACNGLPPSTGQDTVHHQRVNIPVSCACMNGTRTGTSMNAGANISYVVKPNEFLSEIAQQYYGNLVTYQEIAAANGIADPNKIFPNQTLVIPLPCTCRQSKFGNEGAAYLSYAVADGDTLQAVATAHNRTPQELATLNNLKNTTIGSGQVLMVPMRACFATGAGFRSDAIDRNLVVPGGSYAITGAGCVQCACPKNSTQLSCTPGPNAGGVYNKTGTCMTRCSNSSLEIGSFKTRSTSQGCVVDSCLYQGYSILGSLYTSEFTNSTSASCGSVPAPPAFAYAPEAEEAVAPTPGGSGSGAPGSPGTPGSGSGTAPPPQSSAQKNGFSMLAVLFLAAAAVLH